jgi:hypothetical protein
MGAKKKLSTAFLLGVCMFCVQGLGWAQGSRGSISGTVLDASGAVVPAVPVTATDISRGVKYSATATSAGVYTIPSLTVGQYKVEAEMSGFKKFVEEQVEVITGSVTTVNIILQVGAITQQVNVTGSTPLLQTDDAQVSHLMSAKMYQELPLTMNGIAINGSGRRQPEQFILTEPGVDTNIEGDILGKKFNGSQFYSGILLIDGVGTTTSIDGGQFEFASPPYEAMQEFKVQTANLPAEYGGGTGLENLTMKSGTNDYHGNLYEYHRDAGITARGFNPVTKKSKFIQNEFGGTIGGPVVIPHVYNGHNRTFFFGSFGGFLTVGGPPSVPTYTVPTAAERQGDFSALLLPANGGITIYNPATTTFNASTGKYVRTPFAGNIVGPIVPQAAYWLKWIAMPNLPGGSGGLFNNFSDTVGNRLHEWVWSAKVDHAFNDRHRISWSYWANDRWSINYGDVYFSVPIPSSYLHGGGHRVHDYYSITPNLQNEFVVGYTPYYQRTRVCSPGSELGNNPAGVPNLELYNPGGTGQFRFGGSTVGYFRSGGALQGCIPLGGGIYGGRNSNVGSLGETMNYLRGKHNLKFGVNGSKEVSTARAVGQSTGWFTFAGLETAQPGVTNGDSFASFLLGQVDSSSVAGPNIGVAWNNPKLGAFLQDTWKLTSKFTISYGVRWDRPWQSTETHGRVAGLSPSTANSAAGNRLGAMMFLGNGTGRTGTNTFPFVHASNREFGPRIGFAYALDSKTVIRAGYALMWAYGNGDAIGFDNGGAPWQQGIAKLGKTLTSPNSGVTPATTLTTGLPIPTCALPCTDPTFANGGIPMLWDPNAGREPYIQQWTFGIQRNLPGGFFVNAAYVGNKGNNLTGDNDNWNQLPVSYLTTYGSVLTQPYNSTAAIAAGITAPYAGFSGNAGQALRRYPQYSAIADRFDPSGMNRYDALQVSLRKQVGDLQAMVHFTGAKNLSNVGSGAFNGSFSPGPALDTYNLGLEKALDPLTPNRKLVATWLYSLPIGKGKRYAGGAHGVVNQLIGNWEFGAIQTYRSGFPNSVGGGIATAGIFNTETRPNMLPGVPVRLTGCNNVILNNTVLANISAFSANTSLTLGNAPRILNNFRGCAWLGEDFTAQKIFPITEKVRLMFRTDFYNIFNRHKFSDPSLNINSPATFGKIGGVDSYYQPRSVQFAMKLIW